MHEVGHIWGTAVGFSGKRANKSAAAARADGIGRMRRFHDLWFVYIDKLGEYRPLHLSVLERFMD